MKKALLTTLPVAAFVAGMAVVPSVFAAGESYNSWENLETCLKNEVGQEATCTVSADFAATSAVTVGDNVTLDLGGRTLTLNDGAYFYVCNGNSFTVTNGTISKAADPNGYATVYVRGNTKGDPTIFNLESGASIIGNSGILVPDNSGSKGNDYSTITIDGNINSNLKSGTYVTSAISVDGDIKANGPTITVSGQLSGKDAGIYQAGTSSITLNNASVTGGSGIVTKAGTLILNNTQVTATAEYAEGDLAKEVGGFSTTGAALQVVSQPASYAGNIDIQINNSTLTSENGNAIQAFGEGDGIEAIAVSGDTHLTSASGKPALNNSVEGFAGVTEDGEVIDLNNVSVWPVVAPETPTDGTTNPNTADPIALYATVAAVALIGLSVTAVMMKKSRR